MYHSFEELEVWKRGCQLAVAVHEALRDTREFALRNQIQRAAVSVPSNIAEGAERGGRGFQRFLRIARGSAAEFRTQLYIARKIGIVGDEQFSHFDLRAQGNLEDAHRPGPIVGPCIQQLKTASGASDGPCIQELKTEN